MVAIINIIIVIIIGKSYARTWSWLQDDANQLYLVSFSNPNGGKYSVVQSFSSRYRSQVFNGVLLVFSVRFPHYRQQSSPVIDLLEKLWECDRIKTIDIARSTLIFNRICWSNWSPFLNSVPYFWKMHQSSIWEMYISNINKYFGFFIFTVSVICLFILQR